MIGAPSLLPLRANRFAQPAVPIRGEHRSSCLLYVGTSLVRNLNFLLHHLQTAICVGIRRGADGSDSALADGLTLPFRHLDQLTPTVGITRVGAFHSFDRGGINLYGFPFHDEIGFVMTVGAHPLERLGFYRAIAALAVVLGRPD